MYLNIEPGGKDISFFLTKNSSTASKAMLAFQYCFLSIRHSEPIGLAVTKCMTVVSTAPANEMDLTLF